MKFDGKLKQTFKVFVDKDKVINIVGLVFEKDSEDIVRAVELVKVALEEIYNKNPKERYKVLIDMSPVAFAYRNLPTKARKVCY